VFLSEFFPPALFPRSSSHSSALSDSAQLKNKLAGAEGDGKRKAETISKRK
jgi:hypothetical protein